MTSVNTAGINPSIRPISNTERRDTGVSPIDERDELEDDRDMKQTLKKFQFMKFLNLIMTLKCDDLVWLDDLCCLRRRMSKSISRCTCSIARGASTVWQASQG